MMKKDMDDLSIRELDSCGDVPYDLLYMADPSREAVADYLERGRCFVAFRDGIPVGVYVLLPTRPFTAELVNLAVREDCQNRGIGRALIVHAQKTAAESGFRILEVGTGNSGIGQLALYQKSGFTIVSVDFGFFERHYPEPIIENGIPCLHMIRMKMDL